MNLPWWRYRLVKSLYLFSLASFCSSPVTQASATESPVEPFFVDTLSREIFSLQADSFAWSFVSTNSIRNSSPAVALDGTVYVQTYGTDSPAAASPLGALLAVKNDGTLLWSVDTSLLGDSSPAIAGDGTIYIGVGVGSGGSPAFPQGALIAVNSDGSVKWHHSVPGAVLSSPALAADGTIYFGSYDRILRALNPDGSEKWELPTGGEITSRLAIAAAGTIYFGNADSHLNAIDPDGSVRWQFSAGGPVGSAAISPDGTIYAGCYGFTDHHLYAVNPDATLRWSFLPGADVLTAPAIDSLGNVYFGASDGLLYALNRDGVQLWTFPASGRITSSPAIAAGSEICFGSDDGYFYRLHLDGTLLAKVDAAGRISSSPAIDSLGRIYVGTESGSLLALDGTAAPDLSTWPMFGRNPSHTSGYAAQSIPTAVQNPRASNAFAGQITVSWDGAPTLVTYELWRSASDQLEQAVKLAEFLDTTSYADSSVAAGPSYYYWVRARNSAGVGSFSTPASGSRPLPPVGGIIARYSVGTSLSLPGVAIAQDGTVYAGGTHLHAYRAEGTLLWQTPLEGEGVLEGTPAVADDGTIYAGSNDYNVYAFNPNGTVKWKFKGVKDFGAFLNSPAIARDGTIYIGGADTRLYALNPDGTSKWTQTVAPDFELVPINSSAAISSGGIIYVSSALDRLHAFQPTGDLQWAHDPGGSYGPVIGPNGEIYLARDDGTVQAIQSDGTFRWSFTTGSTASGATPVAGPDGTIYCGTSSSNLLALTTTGALKWSFTAGGAVGAAASVSADGTLYFGSSDHFLYAVNQDGTLRWKVETGGAIQSPTAVGQNGTVHVIAQDGSLYFVRGSAPLADSAWPTFHQNNRRTGVSPVIPPPPGLPGSIAASQGTFPTMIRVQWASAEAAVSYDIRRSDAADFPSAITIATKVSGSTYFDASAGFAQHYFYWVRALNFSGASDWGGPAEGYQNLPNTSDSHWSRDFYLPGFATTLASPLVMRAVVTAPNGDMIAGGGFYSMGGVPGTSGLARWNGTEWSSIGGGVSIPGSVYTILVNGEEIYIGGNFKSVGNQPITNIARWDGARWHPLGSGLSGGAVESLAIFSGKLIAGGAFKSTGSDPAHYLAAWDGSTWADLGAALRPSGLVKDSAPPVVALLPFNGSLYIAGPFTTVNSPFATNLVRWDGASWFPVGEAPKSISSLVQFNGHLVAGIAWNNTPDFHMVYDWDGSAWRPLGSLEWGNTSFVYSDSSFLYVGGEVYSDNGVRVNTGLARWNGSVWDTETFRHTFNNGTDAMTSKGPELFVATFLPSSISAGLSGIYHFDGQSWSTMGAGIAAQYPAINAIQPDVGGVFGGGTFGESLAFWKGKSWESRSPQQPAPFQVINAVVRGSAKLYVVRFTLNISPEP